jgi:perosamine synthetase
LELVMGIRSKLLPYGRQLIDDSDVAAVAEQLRDDWLTQGPTVARFESVLCAITGAKYAVAVSSGTAALHLAALAAGIEEGDVALVPDVTFVATANAVRYAGGHPVLVDVDPDTGLVDLGALEELVARHRPRAILPVSLCGAPPDLGRIAALATSVGARVIEDAAHSLGATYGSSGQRSASCADTDMAVLSFHPVKHLTTGEGGAITTNDRSLYESLIDLRTHGITRDPSRLEENDGPWYYEQQRLGFNYRITDLQCALGVSQARRFPEFLARRRTIAARYDAAFADHPRILRPLRVPRGVNSAYHLYVVRVEPRPGESRALVASRRKALFHALREQNIGPQVHYIPVHRQPDYRRNALSDGSFEGAETYYASCISLPMFPGMTDGDVDYVVASVVGALKT